MYYKAINVPRSVDDPTYRYKMPELCITKSAVTKLFNIADVASSLKIPPSCTLPI